MSTSDLKKMVRECLKDDSDRLTTWEIEFLDSVNGREVLSDKQAAVIQKIWDKLFG